MDLCAGGQLHDPNSLSKKIIRLLFSIVHILMSVHETYISSVRCTEETMKRLHFFFIVCCYSLPPFFFAFFDPFCVAEQQQKQKQNFFLSDVNHEMDGAGLLCQTATGTLFLCDCVHRW